MVVCLPPVTEVALALFLLYQHAPHKWYSFRLSVHLVVWERNLVGMKKFLSDGTFKYSQKGKMQKWMSAVGSEMMTGF